MTPIVPAVFADGAVHTAFEWGRIQSNADWIAPVLVCLALMLFVRWMYRRDAAELSARVGWLLSVLRSAVVLGLLIFYLEPQWRTEREAVRNSRVAVLVDTSLSMGLPAGDGPSGAAGRSRSQEAIAAIENTDFLSRLRRTHEVVVLRFDKDVQRVITLEKLGSAAVRQDDSSAAGAQAEPVDWAKALGPAGMETRLGQALQQVVRDESGTPISGIVVVSDGGQNVGVAPQSAIRAAQEAKIPIFAVGLGSDRQPLDVRVADLVVPGRAYPGDRYTVTGFLQGQGMAGRSVAVELLMRDAEADTPGAAGATGSGTLVAREDVVLGQTGEVVPVKFDLEPDRPGRKTLCLRVIAPETDRNPSDNFREADIEIVDRRNHVLLLAGGPMREYQFLRTLLFRDRSTTLDVLLQSGAAGISQEAAKILEEFPASREEMYAYDCVVAFDPNWQALSAGQIELLEGWVGGQGGGLIVMAGSVNLGNPVGGWAENNQMAKIRALYPVEFHHRFSVFDTASRVSKEPWPLEFTREGQEAEFLWLGDTAAVSQQAWAEFPGVFAYYPVRGAKPGATVYARFSDPRSTQDGVQPAYFAEQFFGSGRVFYMGSGEMWRLRAVEPSYFETFYTKLIRHVSQGRLLRGSSRGVLLIDSDRYLLGDIVEVRAQLSGARFEPLRGPSVPLRVIAPGGGARTVTLQADPSRAGAYAGRFTATEEGTWRLDLPIPESHDERLGRRIQVKVPDLEREHPQRNDALLAQIAKMSGGRYYVGLDSAIGAGAREPLAAQLKDRTKTVVLSAGPNSADERRWLRYLMISLCGLLSVEWLIRRLVKLA